MTLEDVLEEITGEIYDETDTHADMRRHDSVIEFRARARGQAIARAHARTHLPPTRTQACTHARTHARTGHLQAPQEE